MSDLNTTTLAGAFMGHLIGDYLLQNDWMALHKKQSSFRCAVHCVLWTLAVCLLAGWTAPAVVGLLSEGCTWRTAKTPQAIRNPRRGCPDCSLSPRRGEVGT